MSKAIERKQELVNQIAEEIKASSSVVIADYRGLNVAEVTELRNNMRNEGLTFKVYKNYFKKSLNFLKKTIDK